MGCVVDGCPAGLALGEADTEARRDEVLRFFGWDRMAAARRRPAPGGPDVLLP